MSDAESFARVWFNRTALADPERPTTAHESAACATRGRDDQAVPSFRAFAEDVDAEDCQVCIDRYNQAETTWTGAAVRDLRDRHALTQADLADRLPVMASSIANWESQGTTPGPEAAAALDDVAADLDASPAPPDIDWDALEPAIRRVEDAGAVEEPTDGDASTETDDEATGLSYDHVCEDCGDAFQTERSLAAHRSTGTTAHCETCASFDKGTYEWYVHRTEAHGKTYEILDNLEAGEFEAHVDAADTVGDLQDALGWSNQKLFQVLGAYGLADVVGPNGPAIADVERGDDSWKQYYERAADGGGRA